MNSWQRGAEGHCMAQIDDLSFTLDDEEIAKVGF